MTVSLESACTMLKPTEFICNKVPSAATSLTHIPALFQQLRESVFRSLSHAFAASGSPQKRRSIVNGNSSLFRDALNQSFCPFRKHANPGMTKKKSANYFTRA